MTRDWWDREFKVLFTLGESTTAGGWSSCRERCWASQLARLINEFQRVPVQLVNVGIGANVISSRSPGYEFSGKPAANERLEQHVLNHHANGHHLVPDLLIISYGLNDCRVGTSVALFCEELADLVRRVRDGVAGVRAFQRTGPATAEGETAHDRDGRATVPGPATSPPPLIVLLGPYYMTDFRLGGPEWHHGSLEAFYEYNEATRRLAGELDCLFVDLLAAYGEADWLVHHDGVHANDLGHRIVANKVFEVLASNCSGLALETRELERHIVPWRDESTLQGA